MSSATTTSPSYQPDNPSGPGGQKTAAATTLSVRRLNVMRIGYLIMGVGLAVTKWSLLFNRSEPWPLFEGVSTYMLVAMGLLALLGLRYPVKMLPILVFESAWKLMWLGAVALPLWTAGQMNAATMEVASSLLWVVIILAVTPWRYAVRHYLIEKGPHGAQLLPAFDDQRDHVGHGIGRSSEAASSQSTTAVRLGRCHQQRVRSRSSGLDATRFISPHFATSTRLRASSLRMSGEWV